MHVSQSSRVHGRSFIMPCGSKVQKAMACLVWIVLISLLFKAFGHGGGNLPLPTGVSMERSIILSDSARLTVAPGELPGYTGWARPEATLAGAFQVQPTSTTVVLTTLPTPWNATFSCGVVHGRSTMVLCTRVWSLGAHWHCDFYRNTGSIHSLTSIHGCRTVHGGSRHDLFESTIH
jgi:hypothetical protein